MVQESLVTIRLLIFYVYKQEEEGIIKQNKNIFNDSKMMSLFILILSLINNNLVDINRLITIVYVNEEVLVLLKIRFSLTIRFHQLLDSQDR